MLALEALFFQRRTKLSRGIDRVSADSFQKNLKSEVQRISDRLIARTYKFSPYMEMLVLKGRDKVPRVIARAVVRDKLLLAALKNVLHEALPHEVPRKLPNQVVRDLLASLAAHKDVEIVRADIRSFYDSISHSKIEKMLTSRLGCAETVALSIAALRVPVVPVNYRRAERNRYLNDRGVPQGLPISNFLANLFLTKFDLGMQGKFLAYHRYVDDMLIVCNKGESKGVTATLVKSLAGLGLKVNKEKTKVFQFEERFEFLGYEIQQGASRPRLASAEKFIRGIASMFVQLRDRRLPGRKISSSWTDEEFSDVFIEELNERITGAISQGKQYGWVFYFNESTDLTYFSRVDKAVKSLARRTDLLTNDHRGKIKTTARAYFETKFSKSSGYITNYDGISDNKGQRKFLVRMGYLSLEDAERMSPMKLDAMFYDVVAQRLARLDKDVGLVS